MKRQRHLGLILIAVSFVLLGCQIAQLFASNPTPVPQPTSPPVVVKSTITTPPTVVPAVPTPMPMLATSAPVVPTTQVVVLPTSMPTQPSPCTNPNTAITSPGMNAIVSGLIEIRGTATKPDMQYWKLEYRSDIGVDYVMLNRSEQAVTDAVLARLSTKTLATGNGAYLLRLTIVQKDGNFGTPCEIRINVQN